MWTVTPSPGEKHLLIINTQLSQARCRSTAPHSKRRYEPEKVARVAVRAYIAVMEWFYPLDMLPACVFHVQLLGELGDVLKRSEKCHSI
jgi:hypothetical protein